MSHQDQHITHLLRELLEQSRKTYRLLEERLPQPSTTAKAAIFFGDNMAPVPGTQVVGSVLDATFTPLEADGVTVTPGTTLTTPPVFSIDNTAAATLVDNGNGTATLTGIAPGVVNVTATGGVFTDASGVATAPLTATNQDTVTAPTGVTTQATIVFTAAPSASPSVKK
jgi:hypothetical protein